MKKAKATDTRESTATKMFAVELPGSNPPAQKVKPAWPNSHRTHKPIPIIEDADTYLLSKVKMNETTKLTTIQLTTGK